jgi:filamentous hemagglutinin family protein
MILKIIYVLLTYFSFSVIALALPQNWNVQEGSADFNKSNKYTLNISTSDKTIINYNSFSIDESERVNFYQPSSSSTVLNRVIGGNPTKILGTLTATGKIFLVNPNGILFGRNSKIDTRALVASTLDIKNSDFLNNSYVFKKYGDKVGASVINQGYIYAREVALLGSNVRNEGKIITTLGTTILASGEKMTLNLDTAGMISIAIDKEVRDKILENGKEIRAGIKNKGKIQADGGAIILTAKALDNIFNYAVNQEGIIEADTIDRSQGKIRLIANRKINVSGKINAEGGIVEVDSEGADFSANINSSQGIFNMNNADTVINGGTYTGSQEWSDNRNITVRGDLTVNNGNLTINADADEDLSGDFTQEYGQIKTVSSGNIKISGYNVTVRSISSAGETKINATNKVTIALPWNYKKQFQVDHTLVDSDLTNFPILVKLDSSNFNFERAKSNGEDIRFIDSNGAPLSYEIEKWDRQNQKAYIWIKLPSLSSSSDTVFSMYYGNSNALDSQNPEQVWNSNYVLVQHLNETSGTHFDSTSNNNDGTIKNGVNQNASGKIANADEFDGTDDYIEISDSSSLNPSNQVTISAWIYARDLGTWASMVAKDESDTNRSYAIFTDSTWNIMKFSIFKDNTEHSSGDWSNPNLNQWINIAGVYDGSNIEIYANGELKNQASFSNGIDTSTAKLMIGKNERMANASNDSYFNGFIDEVRISNIARNSSWLKADYNTVNNANFISYSNASLIKEISGSAGVRYVIPKSAPNVVSWLPEKFRLLNLEELITKPSPYFFIDASALGNIFSK